MRAAGLAADRDVHRGLCRRSSPISRASDFWRRPTSCRQRCDAGKVAADQIAATQTQIFNAQLDAVVCGIFMVLVTLILVDSIRVWAGVLRGTRDSDGDRNPVRPDATAGGGDMKTFFRLLLGLLREIGDENAYARHLKAHGREHSGDRMAPFQRRAFSRKVLAGEVLLSEPLI